MMVAAQMISSCMKNPRRYCKLFFATAWIMLFFLATWRMKFYSRPGSQTRIVSVWEPPSEASVQASATRDLQPSDLAPSEDRKFPDDGSKGKGSREGGPPGENISSTARGIGRASLARPEQPPPSGQEFHGREGCWAGREVFNLSRVPFLPASQACRTTGLPRTEISFKDWFHDKVSGMCKARTGAASGSSIFGDVFGSAGVLPMHIVTIEGEELAMDGSKCTGDASFAEGQQWWRESGPIFETLPPGMLQGASTNVRDIYQIFGDGVKGRDYEKAARALNHEYMAGVREWKEPPLGMAVLHNARFSGRGYAHDCQDLLIATGRACINPSMEDFGAIAREDPTRCQPGKDNIGIKSYDRVYTISQALGTAYYHLIAENLSRLMLMLPELIRETSIKVHVESASDDLTKQAVQLFRISPDRLIDGEGCARMLYIPEAVGCGMPTSSMLHILQRNTRLAIGCPNLAPVGNGSYAVLIYRSAEARRVSNFDVLRGKLGHALHGIGIGVKVHGRAADNTEGMSLKAQWAMFADAYAAIGPHGAGLSNMIAMRRRAVVVEFILPGRNDINLCYTAMATKLGLTYRAVEPRSGWQDGPMEIDVASVVQVTVDALNASLPALTSS